MSTYTNQLVDIRSACPAWINLNQLLEDTFILLDALEEDADALRTLKPSVCLEIGRVTMLCSFAAS